MNTFSGIPFSTLPARRNKNMGLITIGIWFRFPFVSLLSLRGELISIGGMIFDHIALTKVHKYLVIS